MENKNELPFETQDALELLREALRNAPPRTMLLDPIRYREVLEAQRFLDKLLQDNDAAPSTCKLDPFFGCADLLAEADFFIVQDFPALAAVLYKADNVEFCPLTDGRLSISVGFNHVFRPLGENK